MSWPEADEVDAAHMRWEAAQERKHGRACCSECGMVGTHATNCPEREDDDEGDEE
jgi:hypothetical protein